MAGKPNIDAIRALITEAMDTQKKSVRKLAKESGVDHKTLSAVLTTTDNPGIGTLTKVFEVLDISLEISNSAQVPLLGRIGAGGQVLFEEVDEQLSEYETVPRPPLAGGRMMALEVAGASMLPKYEDGDVVYVRRDHDGVLPEYLGEYCAVRTGDGGTWLKILSPGSKAGRYTLRSLNAADMENVEVEWASPVLWVMPRRSRRS